MALHIRGALQSTLKIFRFFGERRKTSGGKFFAVLVKLLCSFVVYRWLYTQQRIKSLSKSRVCQNAKAKQSLNENVK